jgi:hypothetical protein
MSKHNKDLDQHILLPHSAFRGSVFDRQYTALQREDPYEDHLVKDIFSMIQCIYQIDPKHYDYKGLDDQTKYPIRYKGQEDHTIPHLPRWRALIIGERSLSRYLKPSRNSLGSYSLRQTVYIMGVSHNGEETLIPQVYGELIHESGKDYGKAITTRNLPTRAILREAFHAVYEAQKTEINPLIEGLEVAFANS